MAELLIVVHKSKYGYDASCPTLHDCQSQGETGEDALENIHDAIRAYLVAAIKLKRLWTRTSRRRSSRTS